MTKQRESSKLTAGEIAASAAASVFSTSVIGTATVHTQFEQDMRSFPEIADNRPKKRENILRKETEAVKNIPADDFNAIREARIKAVSLAKKENAAGENFLLEKRGYRSTGWNGLRKLTLGTYDRFRQMSGDSKGKIYLNSIITAGVAFGGVLMFFNSHAIARNSSDTRDKLDDLRQKIDALEASKAPNRS